METLNLENTCLVFPFSRVNANAISALLASLDIHEKLQHLPVFLPPTNQDPTTPTKKVSIFDEISTYNKIILAFSVYSTQLQMVSTLIDKYRLAFENSKLIVIAGGPHPIGDPFSMLYNGADIVCTGEGEVVFRDIISNFISGEPLTDILGTAYFREDGIMVKTGRPESIDLSNFPPFSLKHKLIRPIEITRGCAWKCRFCQIRSKGVPVRHRPINQILEYVVYTVEHFSKRRPDIRFVSPNALSYGSKDGKSVDLDAVQELLRGIRSIIGEEGKIYFGSFPSELRPETITKESAELLREYSNVSKLILGGQSGSDVLLEASSRGHNVAEVERAVKLLLEVGFKVDVDIIFGLPGETEADVKLTINHMKRLITLGATIHSHTFLPLVGTPFASERAGKIHPMYKEFIQRMRSEGKLKGQHIKQEKQAEEMEKTRSHELEKRKYEFKVIRK